MSALLVGGAALVFSLPAGQAAAPSILQSRPFKYSFRIVALDVTATLTFGQSKSVSRLRLQKPTRLRWLTWLGPRPKPGARPRTISPSPLYVAGVATYSSQDPACTAKLEYRPSRPVRTALVFDAYSFKDPRLRVSVDKFPLAVPLGGRDSGHPDALPQPCGKSLVDWWDSADAVLPRSVLQQPTFTMTAQRKERFEDPGIESIEWTLRMKVQRSSYRTIDCATEPGC